MENISLIFIALCLMACNQGQKTVTTTEALTDTIRPSVIDTTAAAWPKDTITVPPLSKTDSLLQKLKVQYGEDYDGYMNAVRSLVLSKMKKSILKNTCLEEFYLQELAKTTNDSIVITLPFDLHGYDCGAPDAYTTEVRFSLPKETPIVFPDLLPFYEKQTGFEEYHFKDTYELIEATSKHVIYHCEARRRTLVLFFPKVKGSWRGNVNYFVGVGRNRFNGKNIYTVREKFRDDKPANEWNIAPYMLTRFNQIEYEYMLAD